MSKIGSVGPRNEELARVALSNLTCICTGINRSISLIIEKSRTKYIKESQRFSRLNPLMPDGAIWGHIY